MKNYVAAWFNNPDVFEVRFKVNKKVLAKTNEKHLAYDKIRRAVRNIIAFKLDKLYRFHKDEVGELIVKAQRYNETKLVSLEKQFPELFPSRYDLARLVFGNYTALDSLDRRPLSKMTRDIAQEFSINL